MKRSPMKRGKPLERKTPMAPPRAAMKARRSGKRKTKTVYRNHSLLGMAEGEKCLLRVPSWCQGGTETTVACHSNQARHGKGGWLKAHDWAIAFGCYGCHTYLDQSTAPAEEKAAAFDLGLSRTRLRLIELGAWPAEAETAYQQMYGESP